MWRLAVLNEASVTSSSLFARTNDRAFIEVSLNRDDSLPRNDLCFIPDPCNGFPYITVAG